MKYQANPVVVDAYRILHVGNEQADGSRQILYANNAQEVHGVSASKEMLARYVPVPDDYWVIQEDGYIYVNPKAVFERKYSLVVEKPNYRREIEQDRAPQGLRSSRLDV